MDNRIIPMIRTAVKPYRRVKTSQGDTALIIVDTDNDPLIPQAFALAVESLGGRPIVLTMPTAERDYESPPEPVQKAAEAADIVHYATTKGLIHSEFGRRLSFMGKRRIVSEGVTVEMFTVGAALADDQDLAPSIQKLIPVWDNGKDVHITTPAGTDLYLSLEGHYSYHTAGAAIYKAPSAQFPGGEAPCTPDESRGDGLLVVDKAIHYPHGRLVNPIYLELKDGKIVKISGRSEAEEFEWWLKKYADENGWRVCEVSVGINPYAKYMGLMRQDRFVLGSMHIGFGANDDVGGNLSSNIHYDAVIGNATLRVDDQLIMENGTLLI